MNTAVLFQNMPPLSPEEYQALESSIREHGIQVPIVVDESRTVIDGHHRQKIAQELGIECPKRVVFDKTEAEKRTLALSLNLDRRHLNREQRRALIAESIKADPELSNRQHAERVGASHVTVGTVRSELESTGQVDQSYTRTSADGRTRPASQPERESLPPFDPETGELLDAEPDGKTYPRPESRPAPSRPEPKRGTDLHALRYGLLPALDAWADMWTNKPLLDDTVTAEEAAQILRDLSRTTPVLSQIRRLLNSRTGV